MSELTQALNNVIIEGVLVEKVAKEGNSKGKDYISGELLIEVGPDNVVPVNFFSFSVTQAGAPNKIYASLKSILQNYKSIAEVGRDAATRVRITSGQLTVNEFIGQNGQLVSYFRVRSNFFNSVQGEIVPKAEFTVEAFITKIYPELDRENQETGRTIVQGAVPTYNGGVELFTFIVNDPQGIAFVDKYYEAMNTTAQIGGRIINREEIITKEKEVGFGDPITQESRKTTRELIVVKGTQPYDEDASYSVKAIKAALQERATRIEAMKAEAATKANNEGSGVKGGGYDF